MVFMDQALRIDQSRRMRKTEESARFFRSLYTPVRVFSGWRYFCTCERMSASRDAEFTSRMPLAFPCF